MKIGDYLSNQEIKSFLSPSNVKGWQAVGFDWFLIAAALGLAGAVPNPLTIFLALVIIGGRQLGLAILVHETTHWSLFKTRRLNDFVGKWICGGPIWQDLPRYRDHHIKHHQFAGSAKDPDLSLVAPFPTSRASLRRKFLRDICGITGVKRLISLGLMDFGFLTYTMASDPKRVDLSARPKWPVVRDGLRNILPMVITNALLMAIFALAGKPWLYALWIGAYLTTFSLFIRIRAIAEHACTKMDLDPFQSTRTTLAGALTRLTVAPHRVNFHIEHHLLMTVPYFKLPELHAALTAKGAHRETAIAKNYVEVLRIATSR